MMPVCWSILLLCLSANAVDTEIWKESGRSVTLECSVAKCPSSIHKPHGMYLYHDLNRREEVIYYFSESGSEKVTPREKYDNRAKKIGSLKNHNITISNLTVNDSGTYICEYRNYTGKYNCSVYRLFVFGVAPCPSLQEAPQVPPSEPTSSPPVVLISIVTCAVSIMATAIFILLIVPSVKRLIANRRGARSVPRLSNDYVYEVMTKNGLRPPADPQ